MADRLNGPLYRELYREVAAMVGVLGFDLDRVWAVCRANQAGTQTA